MKNLLIVLLVGLMPLCYGAKFAIIKDSKVINIIEADATNANTIAASLGATAVRSDAAGIGQSYINGIFADIAPAVTPEPEALTALKSALSAEITRLNAAYTGLNLTTSDTLVTAIPKLFAAGVTKSDSAFLFTLYQAIKEAGR